ncbi:hypothetical protein [Sphingorhabdus sp. 109]|jgi:hypothetical protein|uniref:hypothetical protein n=1 Tax=Sphingorhabdus sp. 109 TaxID=2653173 RepID=UPI00135C3999|nr:hypothetical protein [Sphingorhabdus sp. 109]
MKKSWRRTVCPNDLPLFVPQAKIVVDNENKYGTLRVHQKNKRDRHMLAIAISTFFALAFLGAVAVIAMMFSQYRGRISRVIQSEFRGKRPATVIRTTICHQCSVKAPQPTLRHSPIRPVPLRAAA